MDGIRIEVKGSLREIPAEAWDRLASGSSVYSTYRWLSNVEHRPDRRGSYLAVFAGEHLIAALPVYEFFDDVPHFYDPTKILPLVPGEYRGASGPLLIGGASEGYATDLLVDPDLATADTNNVVSLMVAAFRALAASSGGWAMCPYLAPRWAQLIDETSDATDEFFLTDARAVLRFQSQTVDGHLRSLGRNVWKTSRRERAAFAASGVKTTIEPLSRCYTEIAPLSAELLRKYGHAVTVEAQERYFAQQAETIDDICHVFVARAAGKAVGFAQFFRWRDCLFGWGGGFSRAVPREAALYFNLVFYEPMAYALREGINEIDYGCEAFEAKSRRGARVQPLWAWIVGGPTTEQGRKLRRDASRVRARDLAAVNPDMVATDAWDGTHA